MAFSYVRNYIRYMYIYKIVFLVIIAFAFILLGNVSYAADNTSKFQVVPGNDDKAYLVDTTTGFVWVLTYRSLAGGGREPIAIPYKFIKICPKSQKNFIVEDADGVCLPERTK
jgi:hypothetical protein